MFSTTQIGQSFSIKQIKFVDSFEGCKSIYMKLILKDGFCFNAIKHHNLSLPPKLVNGIIRWSVSGHSSKVENSLHALQRQDKEVAMMVLQALTLVTGNP